MARGAVRVVVLAVAVFALGVAGGYVGAELRGGDDGDVASGNIAVREVIGQDIPDDEQTAEGVTLKIAQARCEEGEVLTGGGFRVFGESRTVESQVHVKEAVAGMTEGVAGTMDPAFGSPDAWTVWAYAPAGIGDWGLDARAHCAAPR